MLWFLWTDSIFTDELSWLALCILSLSLLSHTQADTSCRADPRSQYFLCFTEQLITRRFLDQLYKGLSCLYLQTKQWTQIVCPFFLYLSLLISWLDDQDYNSLSFCSFPCHTTIHHAGLLRTHCFQPFHWMNCVNFSLFINQCSGWLSFLIHPKRDDRPVVFMIVLIFQWREVGDHFVGHI